MLDKKDKKVLYLRHKFDDFEHLHESAAKWSLDFKQLDSGNFLAEMMMLNMEDIQLSYSHFNRKFDQKGNTPAGYRTFAIPANRNQSFIARGQQVNSNNLMVFPKSGEIDGISFPGFEVFTLSIAEELIDRFYEQENIKRHPILDCDTGIIEMKPQTINTLRHQLHYLTTKLQDYPKLINKKAFQQIFTQELPTLLLNNLGYHNQILTNIPSRVRDIAFKKAVDYLRHSESDMPTVKELCLIAGASQRTLEYAFKEQYGIGPKEFMQKQRLNIVRKALHKADPHQTKIQDIAHRYGFWHLGQFAADYKKLFEESPSETLRKD